MITIDDKSTKDIDDAIWVEQTETGWNVSVGISDVAEVVEKGDALDAHAAEIVATRYFATGNRPMLPRRLSEQQLSLWPGKTKNVMLVRLKLDRALEVQDVKVSDVSPLLSEAKLAYSDVPLILRDGEAPTHAMLTAAQSLAIQLMSKRRNNGAFVVYDLANGWVTTEEGYLRRIEKKEDVVGQIIIQELMILVNTEMAKLAVEYNVPVIFRNHEARAAAPDRGELMHQINEAQHVPLENLETIRQRTYMLLGQADYGASLRGHYGLNLPAYLHFTSPIRRYADLVNHRQLKAHIRGAKLPYTKDEIQKICEHLNAVEKAERQSAKDHYKATHEKRVQREAFSVSQIVAFNTKDFERLTKLEVRSGEEPSDTFEEGYRARLSEDATVPLLCQTLVLGAPVTPGWQALKSAVLFAMSPENAVSCLAQAVQVLGWPAASYRLVGQSGPSHMPVFVVEAHLPGVGTFKGEAESRKRAQQLAALGALTLAAEKPPPEGTAQEAPEAPEPAQEAAPAPEKAPLRLTDNPVGALQEYCQVESRSLPTYTFEKTGPDHVPTITCTVALGSLTGQATASSKKEAKRRAAAVMITILGGE